MNEGLSKLKSIFTKRVIIILATLVALFIIFYPHTKKTEVNAELSGVFVAQEERYILHQRVELETNYICLQGQRNQSTSIHYSLLGSIKKIVFENCDGTTFQLSYNSDGTLKYQKVTSLSNNIIRTEISEYTKMGQLLKTDSDYNGINTITELEYTNNERTKTSEITTTYGEKTNEFVETYDEKGLPLLKTSTTWIHGDIDIETTTTYKEGEVTNVEYTNETDDIEATIVCADDSCTLNNLTGPFYTVVYNLTTLKYDLDVDGETTTTSNFLFQQITEQNYLIIFEYIEEQAQMIKDIQE